MASRLYPYLQGAGYMPDRQYGFVKSRSTSSTFVHLRKDVGEMGCVYVAAMAVDKEGVNLW